MDSPRRAQVPGYVEERATPVTGLGCGWVRYLAEPWGGMSIAASGGMRSPIRLRSSSSRLLTLIALAGVVTGCSGVRGARSPVSVDSSPDKGDFGTHLVHGAMRFEGVPYRYGGTDKGGMDCSGLVWRVCRDLGLRVPRTSRRLFDTGKPVSRQGLEPGDLVFFSTGSRGGVDHVGILVGGSAFIHASTGGGSVRLDDLRSPYFASRYRGARRIRP